MTQFGTFVPKPKATGDRFQPSMVTGRPLIVQVLSFDGARQVAARAGQAAAVKQSVTVNVWDLVGGPVAKDDTTQQIVNGPPNTVYCNVMWMSTVVAENLEPFVGAPPMPLRIVSVKNQTNEFRHLEAQAVDGPELQQVQAFFAQDPGRIDREFQAKLQAAAQQAAAPAYQQTGFQPMGVQPAAPQQFQAPAGQPGPVAQIPAQVAQQWQQPAAQYQQPAAQFQAPPANGGYATPPQQPAFQPPNGQAQPQYAPYDAGIQGQLPVAPTAPPQAYGPPQQAAQQPVPPTAAPGNPGYVQSSDVAQIIAGLTNQPQYPPQQ